MRIILLIALVVLTCSCAKMNHEYPSSPEEKRDERIGKITGDGIVIGGGSLVNNAPNITVNTFLWQASIDVMKFMPLNSTDVQSGIIITDWYKLNHDACSAYKANVFIKSKDLKSDALDVSVYKSNVCASKSLGNAIQNSELSDQLKEQIIKRARTLKLGKEFDTPNN